MTSSLQWIQFPQSLRPPDVVKDVVWAFEQVEHTLDSVHQDNLKSDDVLALVCPFLQKRGLRWKQVKREQIRFSYPSFTE